MQVLDNAAALRERLQEWRRNGEHVALVPTMGNLHAGHISLVELAREHAERIVVTIFVNPTQFGENEDYDDYPRTIERDTRRLKAAGADLVFVPDVRTMYPFGVERATVVSVPHLTGDLCGASRPGHFDGVTSVVARLFAIVQPDVAVFGQKDFQQQLVIRFMVEDLHLPIKIVTGPIVREPDGLAMSSRNQYLDATERTLAPRLHAEIEAIGQALQTGRRDYDALQSAATDALERAGFRVDYVQIRRSQDLAKPDRDCDEIVVLAAVFLGAARLIDNVVVTT